MLKRKNTFQICLDQNGNIRVNNLPYSNFVSIFNDSFEEIATKNLNFKIEKNLLSPDDIMKDINYVRNLYKQCEICFRACKVDRVLGQHGYCKLDASENVYMAGIISQEEEIINPTYAIYFSSCNIECSYCHQKKLMRPSSENNYLSISEIIRDIFSNKNRIKSISFIGGNPDISLLNILKIIFELTIKNLRFIYVLNSNFLFTSSIEPFIGKYFDILIPDIKYWSQTCIKNCLDIFSYKKNVTKNILKFRNSKFIIIRHLPLKGHWECCSKPIIEWIEKYFSDLLNYSVSFLDMLYYDNSKEISKCVNFAKDKKLIIS